MPNGGILGKNNAATPSIAQGIWRLEDVYSGEQSNTWAGDYEILNFVSTGSTGTVTFTNNSTTSVTFFKATGVSAWDTQAYCPTAFTAPVTLEFNKTASVTDDAVSYAMICFNEDPTTDASYSSLDYAAYPYRTDNYSVYNNGTQTQYSGAWSTSTKFYIVYGLDGYINHYNGSTLLYSAYYGTGKTVYVDSSIYIVNNPNATFSNVRVRRKTWNGTIYV